MDYFALIEVKGIYLAKMVERSGWTSAGKMLNTWWYNQPVYSKMEGYPKH